MSAFSSNALLDIALNFRIFAEVNFVVCVFAALRVKVHLWQICAHIFCELHTVL